MKKLLSLILCISMLLTAFGSFGIANAAVVTKGQVADGTSDYAIKVAGTDANNATTLETDVNGTFGKPADDKIFKLTKTIGNGSEGRCTLSPYNGWEMGVRAIMSFDVCFMSDDASFNVGYAASKEGATSDASDQCNNVNYFFTMSPTNGFAAGKMFTLTDGVAPKSLDTNKWYNIAIEVPNDGTSTAYVYINGVRYTGYFHEANKPESEIKSYGVRHMRANHLKGVLGIDNYYFNNIAQETDLYDATLYQMNEISVTENEKVSYDADTKKLVLYDASLTAGELKELIDAGENSIAIYESTISNAVVADDAAVGLLNSVVVSNDNGAYRYYEFYRENTSDFEINVNADAVSATVTGFKEGKTPTEAGTAVTIPETIEGYTVTAIADNAFDHIETFGLVTFPDTLKTIGENAFAYCFGMDVDEWPASLEVVGKNAFNNAKTGAIIYGDFSNTRLKTLEEGAFNCSGLRGIVLPDTLEAIGYRAFNWCSMGNIVIPDSVTHMGTDVFINGYDSLKSIRFPENSVFTTIPDKTIDSSYPDNAERLLGDVSLYIPENIKAIPTALLKDFKDGATVTIYGEFGSAAQKYAKTINEALLAGTYTNDLGGKLAEVKFVEYDFENNSVLAYDETGINKGDGAIKVSTVKEGTVVTPSVPGVGGKMADDVVVSFVTASGNNGTNYVSSGKNVWEMSIMAPSENEARINLIYYYTSDKSTSARHGEDVVKVKSDGVYLMGSKVVSSVAGRWMTIAMIVPEEGDSTVTVYINGIKYECELTKTFYGVNRYAFYKSGGLSTLYLDNFRKGDSYNPKTDAAATVSVNSDNIRIYKNESIVYTDADASYTAGELLSMLETDLYSRANIRVYNSTLDTLIAEDETVPEGAVVVVAATNGYSHERTYSYYTVNPPVNTTVYAITPNADGVTATVTGWNEENITEVDDLSIISIPEKIAGYTITAIGTNAFKDNDSITSINLPDTVEIIGDYAFAGKCVDPKVYGVIKDIKWPANLKSIGAYAFAYQTMLEEINLPHGVESIGAYAFYWITGLKKAILPESVTEMGTNVFRISSALKFVKLPGGVKTIPANIFAGVNAIKTLIIPAGITADAGSAWADYTAVSPVVYGVSGTFAEEFALAHGYEFVGLLGGIISETSFMGDGDKKIIGSDHDIKNPCDKIYLNASYTNISSEQINATAIIAAYDASGKMLACNSKDITIGIGETKEITNEDNFYIENLALTDGCTLKAMLWRQENNEPLANVNEVVYDETNKEVHVLLIGNSYGNDSFSYIRQIAAEDDVTLKTYNLYIGGGALYNQHYKYVLSGEAKYQPVINMNYMTDRVSIEQGIKSGNWDYVALQANSTNGSRQWFFAPDYTAVTDSNGVKYSEYWSTISDKVSEWAPGAEKLTHMTWSESDPVAFADITGTALAGVGTAEWDAIRNAGYSGYDDESYVVGTAREAFFNAVKDRYEEGNMHYSGKKENVIPSAVAIYLAITKYGFADFVLKEDGTYNSSAPAMYRDTTCHLATHGKVLAGLTWYETLTGNDVTKNTYQHSVITAENMAKLKAAAHEACQMYKNAQ